MCTEQSDMNLGGKEASARHLGRKIAQGIKEGKVGQDW